eukprot:TRINITY_DN582_c0_g1_i6.p1 TRINITY_DN582_c0_g1~~TRINITY_DN582_c0_g1_i6.p1  ORF type:complete len:541 (-),score=67.80 TRINITY_DN582_c0_g1_i6:1126-2748(-)
MLTVMRFRVYFEQVTHRTLQLWQVLHGEPVMSIRLVRNNSTGQSRGFAFVDFADTRSAQQYLSSLGSNFEIDGSRVTVEFSSAAPPPAVVHNADWLCSSCEASNFARRTACYQCGVVKPVDAVPAETFTSATVIVRNLGPFTSDATVIAALNAFGSVQNARVVMDPVTGLSKGFAFVDLASERDAQNVVASGAGMRIEDRIVQIALARRKSNERRPLTEAEIYIRNYGAGVTVAGAPAVYVPPVVPAAYIPPVIVPQQPHQIVDQMLASASAAAAAKTTDAAAETTAPSALLATGQPLKISFAKKEKAPVTAYVGSGRTNAMIGRWNQKNQELKEDLQKEESDPQPLPSKKGKGRGVNAQPIGQTFVAGADDDTVPLRMATTSSAKTAGGESKHICLLCKRQFNSLDMLHKHEQLSALHRTNVEAARLKQESFREDLQQRQREDSEKMRQSHEITQVASMGVAIDAASNIGGKMMQKMGWATGEGLGREAAGIAAPIETNIRTDRTGLGSHTANIEAGDTYAEIARKKARARWEEMQDKQ